MPSLSRRSGGSAKEERRNVVVKRGVVRIPTKSLASISLHLADSGRVTVGGRGEYVGVGSDAGCEMWDAGSGSTKSLVIGLRQDSLSVIVARYRPPKEQTPEGWSCEIGVTVIFLLIMSTFVRFVAFFNEAFSCLLLRFMRI